MRGQFSAGDRDADRAEESFWMLLTACRKPPKLFCFMLKSNTEQAAGCPSPLSPYGRIYKDSDICQLVFLFWGN